MLLDQGADEELKKSTFKVVFKGIKAEHTPDVQLAATTALCKLMLTSVIHDDGLLQQIVICYLDPATKDNAGVRQALTYFLPVFCHSKRENMEQMARIAARVMHAVMNLSDELEEGEDMVSLSIVGNMLVDWTDARHLVVQDEAAGSWDESGKKEVKAADGDTHLILAESLLGQAMDHTCSSISFPTVPSPSH